MPSHFRVKPSAAILATDMDRRDNNPPGLVYYDYVCYLMVGVLVGFYPCRPEGYRPSVIASLQ